MTTKKLEKNILMHTLNLITSKRVYMSIFGVYLMSSTGATEQAIGLTVFLGSIASFLMEVPSGYISDRIGHKKSLVLARLFLLLSTVLYLLGGEVWIFVAGAIFLNLGLSFTSGAGIALIHETLEALGRDREYAKIVGKARAYGYAVPALLVMVLPFLISIHIKLPFVVAVVVDIIGLFAALNYVTPPKHMPEHHHQEWHFKEILREGMRTKFLRYAALSSVIGGAIGAAVSFSDAYQNFLEVPIVYYGVFWGIAQMLTAGLLLSNHKIKEVMTIHQFYLFRIVTVVATIAVLGVAPSPAWVVTTFIILITIFLGFGEVHNHYELELLGKRNRFKATLFSIRGLLTNSVKGISALIMGILITTYDYSVTFTTYAVFLLLVFGGWYFYLVTVKDKQAL